MPAESKRRRIAKTYTFPEYYRSVLCPVFELEVSSSHLRRLSPELRSLSNSPAFRESIETVRNWREREKEIEKIEWKSEIEEREIRRRIGGVN